MKFGRDCKNDCFGSAIIRFEKGAVCEFNAAFCLGTTPGERGWSVTLSGENNVLLYVQVYLEEGLQVGEYDGYIAMRSLIENDQINEKYDSYDLKKESRVRRERVEIAILEVDEMQVKGEFSTVLYSKSGRKAMVRGHFNVPLE